jgi:hypothetical protein
MAKFLCQFTCRFMHKAMFVLEKSENWLLIIDFLAVTTLSKL